MSQRELKNIAASVRARLLQEAKQRGESYDQTLQYFAIERFLYRLSKTEWGERFVVKGAIMLRAWGTPLGRPTRDIDFLGRVDNSPDAVERAVRECLAVDYPNDGLVFDSAVETVEINIADRYPGVRVVVRGNLDRGTFKLQLDVGIDDAVVPDPEWVDYPTLLQLDAPRILAYQPATALAEKFETIVSRGFANSRLRDYYDIWLLSTLHEYNGAELSAAIRATFEHRGTPLPTETPSGLTSAFHDDADTQARWRSFLDGRNVDAPSELSDVCEVIIMFMMVPAAAAGDGFSLTWQPSSGWS
ncbi:MAG: nucleotidyl transferase AbiEii/AbiGii toxin family protein [Coriobacteriia bacterium]|nr:nucleotidyl transferase AbiEii/AbiGii toxin family protein [Coriobacteriia bacterium]